MEHVVNQHGINSDAPSAEWKRRQQDVTSLLVAYCHRFDILIQSSRIYFLACTIGQSTPVPEPWQEDKKRTSSYEDERPRAGLRRPSDPDRSRTAPGLWDRSPGDLCGTSSYAKRTTGSPVPGPLYPPHKSGCGPLAKGASFVLDWQRLCGEYQFDMTI
ncbi:unnamed protein product [Ranitomeya imitator]|uniref:Uncharacterized protein n=1 Tax=Ranitomeya imitator TaxID=111125 RepID=A0ABN9MIC6_9NEOB|nr:unnamed protein product [Ranitomeya imitator]